MAGRKKCKHCNQEVSPESKHYCSKQNRTLDDDDDFLIDLIIINNLLDTNSAGSDGDGDGFFDLFD